VTRRLRIIVVMPGLGHPALWNHSRKDVDGRDKLGHDEIVSSSGWKDLTALIAFSVRFSG
jgi:hypothetical protein